MIAADIKKQIIYLASVAIPRRLFADGQADKIMLERLNQKNAENELHTISSRGILHPCKNSLKKYN